MHTRAPEDIASLPPTPTVQPELVPAGDPAVFPIPMRDRECGTPGCAERVRLTLDAVLARSVRSAH